jgi:hypothetical protein
VVPGLFAGDIVIFQHTPRPPVPKIWLYPLAERPVLPFRARDDQPETTCRQIVLTRSAYYVCATVTSVAAL